MSGVNWWLMLLSFLLGAVVTWFWMVRRASREVLRADVDRDDTASASLGSEAAGAGAGVVGASGAALGAAAPRDRDGDPDLDVDGAPAVGTPDSGASFERSDLDEVDVSIPEPDAPGVEAAPGTDHEPTGFTERPGDIRTSSEAEIIEAESGLETPAAPTGEADWDRASAKADPDAGPDGSGPDGWAAKGDERAR